MDDTVPGVSNTTVVKQGTLDILRNFQHPSFGVEVDNRVSVAPDGIPVVIPVSLI